MRRKWLWTKVMQGMYMWLPWLLQKQSHDKDFHCSPTSMFQSFLDDKEGIEIVVRSAKDCVSIAMTIIAKSTTMYGTRTFPRLDDVIWFHAIPVIHDPSLSTWNKIENKQGEILDNDAKSAQMMWKQSHDKCCSLVVKLVIISSNTDMFFEKSSTAIYVFVCVCRSWPMIQLLYGQTKKMEQCGIAEQMVAWMRNQTIATSTLILFLNNLIFYRINRFTEAHRGLCLRL